VANETVPYVQWSLDGRMFAAAVCQYGAPHRSEWQKQGAPSAGADCGICECRFHARWQKSNVCSNDLGAWKIYSIGLDGQNRKTITVKTNASNFCLSPLLRR